MLKQKADEREVELRAEIPPDLPGVLGDRDRLEQVLINLIDNAIKYSGSGSSVRVVARALEGTGGRAGEIAGCGNGVRLSRKDVPPVTQGLHPGGCAAVAGRRGSGLRLGRVADLA